MATLVRCKSSLERERERLEAALNSIRTDLMNSGHPNNFRMLLEEAHLQGQIKAIEFAMGADSGGWPHDSLFVFTDAREAAVLSMHQAGKDYEEIVNTLGLTEAYARLIVKLKTPDPKN